MGGQIAQHSSKGENWGRRENRKSSETSSREVTLTFLDAVGRENSRFIRVQDGGDASAAYYVRERHAMNGTQHVAGDFNYVRRQKINYPKLLDRMCNSSSPDVSLSRLGAPFGAKPGKACSTIDPLPPRPPPPKLGGRIVATPPPARNRRSNAYALRG